MHTGILTLALTFAATIDVYPQDDLWGALSDLQPGDEVIVHEGTYQTPGFIELVLNGAEGMPIIIRAADGESVTIQGVPNQNTLNIEGSWYEFRGFEVTVGSHGLRLGSSAHAVFEDVHIHDVGDVGISCNRPGNTYEDITIRRLHIHDTGTGGGPGECMYLGCNNDDCQMWDSLIEFNWCHDTLAGSQGDGIELKTGSYNSVIRHNVVHDVKYPGITVYGTVGNKPANIVEGNAVWNVVDNGIQTVGDVIVRNNIVMNVGASGIAAKPSQGEVVENLEVSYNTVVGAGDACLRGNELPGGSNNVIANNALYCGATSAIKFPQGPGDAVVTNNAVVGALNGQDMGTLDGVDLATAFLDAGSMELYPSAQGPLVDAGSSAHGAAEDFNCVARDNGSPEIGAYDNAASPDANPGWVVQEGFKECADDGGETTGTTGDPTTGGETTGDSSETDTGEETTTSTTGGPDTGEETTTSSSSTGDEPCFSSGCEPTVDPSTTAGGESAGATGTDTEVDADGDDGCGCTQSGAGSSASSWLLLLLGLGLLRRRD